jgi:hypothetical protein
MNVSTTIPNTVQIRRSRLLGLVGGAAAVAAAVTWAVLAFGVGIGDGTRVVSGQVDVLSQLSPSARQYVEAVSTMTPVELRATFGTGDVDAIDALNLSPGSERYVRSIVSMTPAQLRATFGTGPVEGRRTDSPLIGTHWRSYWPTARAAALASLTPKELRYVGAIMTMTPAELAATFGTGK